MPAAASTPARLERDIEPGQRVFQGGVVGFAPAGLAPQGTGLVGPAELPEHLAEVGGDAVDDWAGWGQIPDAVQSALSFDGDRSKWTGRNHRMSEMSRLLTGEELPYATLMYVWANHDAPETVIVNARTDRIRKVVVESGAQQVGHWRDYQRNIRADFFRAFGEEPGPLRAVAIMTDTDNTQTSLRAWYGRMTLTAR